MLWCYSSLCPYRKENIKKTHPIERSHESLWHEKHEKEIHTAIPQMPHQTKKPGHGLVQTASSGK